MHINAAPAPSNISLFAATTTSITLTWMQPPDINITHYQVNKRVLHLTKQPYQPTILKLFIIIGLGYTERYFSLCRKAIHI